MHNLREKMLAEAIRIGDELVALAIHHPTGVAWKSVLIQEESDAVVWAEQESIYNGACGIALFLIELHRKTDNPVYLETARQAMRWVEASIAGESAVKYSLLTGLMSVPFVLQRLYEVTQQREYLEKALQIAGPFAQLITQEAVYEFINGLSGTLLGLLHLHAASQDPHVLDMINAFTEKIIGHIHHGEQGFCWDRSDTNIHALCGFSHGAAGVGFVFLELGHYFSNEAFYWVAEQAFRYEQLYYDDHTQSWLDLRSGIFTEAHRVSFAEAYRAGDLGFFVEPQAMNAWCHGGAGIGLSRIRAYELLRKAGYRTQAEAAAYATRTADMDTLQTPRFASFNLCHGRGGNADLMLEAYRVLGDEQYLTWATEVAQLGLQTHQEVKFYRSGAPHNGEDTSLFLGNAGIGYFYLRVLDPIGTPSVLAPRLDRTASQAPSGDHATLRRSLAGLQRQIIGQMFPRTLGLLEQIAPAPTHAHFQRTASQAAADLKTAWFDFVAQQEKALPTDQCLALKDIAGLEFTKWKLENAILSDTLLQYKADEKGKDAPHLLDLEESAFGQLELLLDKDMLLYQTRWDWQERNASAWLAPPDEYCYLLTPAAGGPVQERRLTAFSYRVLAGFDTPQSTARAAAAMMSEFEVPPEKMNQLQALIFEQVRQAVKSGILLNPKQHLLNAVGTASTRQAFHEA
ncbi:MAG: hypothetical protein H7Z75_04550 [Ferruginibacter sp.]|nr:hypothetical protein [Cytophagales bacterium]